MHLVGGVGSIQFPEDPRHYIVEADWPSRFVSPTLSGGKRRLRIFPGEWKWCMPHMHGVLPD